LPKKNPQVDPIDLNTLSLDNSLSPGNNTRTVDDILNADDSRVPRDNILDIDDLTDPRSTMELSEDQDFFSEKNVSRRLNEPQPKKVKAGKKLKNLSKKSKEYKRLKREASRASGRKLDDDSFEEFNRKKVLSAIEESAQNTPRNLERKSILPTIENIQQAVTPQASIQSTVGASLSTREYLESKVKSASGYNVIRKFATRKSILYGSAAAAGLAVSIAASKNRLRDKEKM